MAKRKTVISEITATADEVRRGRPVSPEGPRDQSVRLSRDLVRRAVAALASVDIDATGAEAVTQCASVGVDATIGKLTVMDEKTRDQFVREVEEEAVKLVTHRAVEAVCKRLGVQAEYHPGTNKFRLTIPHEIKPCVIDAPFDADALTQHAVKH